MTNPDAGDQKDSASATVDLELERRKRTIILSLNHYLAFLFPQEGHILALIVVCFLCCLLYSDEGKVLWAGYLLYRNDVADLKAFSTTSHFVDGQAKLSNSCLSGKLNLPPWFWSLGIRQLVPVEGQAIIQWNTTLSLAWKQKAAEMCGGKLEFNLYIRG